MNKTRVWFEAMGMFLKAIRNYRESIVGNELTLMQAWNLCYSIKSAKYDPGTPFRAVVRRKKKQG